ncbi:MAG TPA: hypothetical protein PKA13_14365 [Geminicoccaceae bacterium]|nr:hypothetical protein [Geminicoccus sp.]HMU50954.1 hypothetical protein [Geminicoccaceae bacterium]
MVRPVERFRIGTQPPPEEETGGRARRLRPGEPEAETPGVAAIACWLLSVALAGYAAWQLAGLWLAP